jgi:hypothetical protein
LKKRPKRLLLEFEYFCRKVEPFNDETFEQFGDDVFKNLIFLWKVSIENWVQLLLKFLEDV